MNDSPVILIHSGIAAEDVEMARLIDARRPGLALMTAHGEAEVRERLPQAEILFAYQFPVHLLPLGTRLRWFQVMGAGVDGVVSGPRLPDVVVTNVRGIFGVAMAEYALAYMLAHAQGLRRVLDQQAARQWEQFTPSLLSGSTVGIVGMGSIGREVAARCAALGMRVIGLKREPGDVPGVERVYPADQIDAFLPRCDYLVCVVPNTPRTTGLLTRERLRALKPGAFLVNMGRGNIVREQDLAEALHAGWLAGAAVDVFNTEPLPPDSPLWDAPNVAITPHISGVNRPEQLVTLFLDNLDRYLRGEPLRFQVDFERGY
jgi:phosphoglycerate dehydrogenase-like enzyme